MKNFIKSSLDSMYSAFSGESLFKPLCKVTIEIDSLDVFKQAEKTEFRFTLQSSNVIEGLTEITSFLFNKLKN